MVIAECTSHFQERVRSGGVKPPSGVHNTHLALFFPARIIEHSYQERVKQRTNLFAPVSDELLDSASKLVHVEVCRPVTLL